MRILFSWYAYNNDFVISNEGKSKRRQREISSDSPTWNLHKFHWNNYDKHILLSSNDSEDDLRYYDFLYSELVKEFKTQKVEKMILPITDPIDVSEITQKVNKLLSEFSEHEIEIFVSPGTPQMQIAWYLSATNFKGKVKLFQLRPVKYSKDKTRPDKVEINLNKAVLPTNLNVSSSLIGKKKEDSKILITDSIGPIYKKAEAIANTYDVTALILGENGTGKENLAKYIHDKSLRSPKPFKAVNCAAFSDELLASELFGHKKGSFTGAYNDKKGILEEADGGTVFLDEIGDITKKMQVSLLRVLQEKEIQPIGSNEVKKIDVRIIAATNRNLIQLAKEEEFRWDLFFRLSVAELRLPPLRERGLKEIKLLLAHFVKTIKTRFPERKKDLLFSNEAEKSLLNYNFPGNIRELENLVISLYTFCGDKVEIADLPDKINFPFSDESFKLEDAEKKHILLVYKVFKENILQTAYALDISTNKLKDRLDSYCVRNS